MLANPLESIVKLPGRGHGARSQDILDFPIPLTVDADLAACIVGLQDDDARIAPCDQIDGRGIALQHEIERMVAVVFTVGEQIAESLELHMGLGQDETKKRTVELLEMVGIPEAKDRIDDYPHQFSGGMRQRAMIAMALSCDPYLLIADEPTTALDVTIQAQILDLVKRLKSERGLSILWITHDLGIIAGLADRVLVMYAGYVVESAEVKDLYRDPRHPYTLGLLASVPRLDDSARKPLTPIVGAPPDQVNLPQGCPFHPRCYYAMYRCSQTMPEPRKVENGHVVACWVDVPRAGTSGSLEKASLWSRDAASSVIRLT